MIVALSCKQCKQILFRAEDIRLGYCHRHSTPDVANWLALGIIHKTQRAEGRIRLAGYQARQFTTTRMDGETGRFVWWVERDGCMYWHVKRS